MPHTHITNTHTHTPQEKFHCNATFELQHSTSEVCYVAAAVAVAVAVAGGVAIPAAVAATPMPATVPAHGAGLVTSGEGLQDSHCIWLKPAALAGG